MKSMNLLGLEEEEKSSDAAKGGREGRKTGVWVGVVLLASGWLLAVGGWRLHDPDLWENERGFPHRASHQQSRPATSEHRLKRVSLTKENINRRTHARNNS
jgi:hypothetical protein